MTFCRRWDQLFKRPTNAVRHDLFVENGNELTGASSVGTAYLVIAANKPNGSFLRNSSSFCSGICYKKVMPTAFGEDLRYAANALIALNKARF